MIKRTQPVNAARHWIASSISVLAVFFALAANAEPSLQLDSVIGVPGETVTLTLSIAGGTAEYGGLHIEFEVPQGFDFTGATARLGLGRFTIQSNTFFESPNSRLVLIAHSLGSNFGSDGDLLELRFLALQDAEAGASILRFTLSNISDSTGLALIVPQSVDGIITLEAAVGEGEGEGPALQEGEGEGAAPPEGEGQSEPVLSISGIITDDSTGEPLSCATVVATAASSDPIVVTTDLSGFYAFDDIPNAEYALDVFSADFTPQFESVLSDGSQEIELDFALAPRSGPDLVFGTVNSAPNEVEDTGQPLAGVRVTASQGGEVFDTVYSCATGEFEIQVPIGKGTGVTLDFEAPGFDIEPVEDPDPATPLTIVATPKIAIPGFIFGVVRNANTETPIEDANVWVFPSGQAALSFPRVTDETGVYIVGNLGSGQYKVKAQVTNFEVNTRTVSKSGDEVGLPVDLDMIPIEQFEGESGGETPPEGEGGCAAAPGPPALFPFRSFLGDVLILVSLAGALSLRRRRRAGKRGL